MIVCSFRGTKICLIFRTFAIFDSHIFLVQGEIKDLDGTISSEIWFFLFRIFRKIQCHSTHQISVLNELYLYKRINCFWNKNNSALKINTSKSVFFGIIALIWQTFQDLGKVYWSIIFHPSLNVERKSCFHSARFVNVYSPRLWVWNFSWPNSSKVAVECVWNSRVS